MIFFEMEACFKHGFALFLVLAWHVHSETMVHDVTSCHQMSSVGREFYLGIPHLEYKSNPRSSFFINIASKSPGRVYVSFPKIGSMNEYNVPAGGMHIAVPYDYVLPQLNSTEHNGIYLRSEMDISVSVLGTPANSSISYQGMDGYLALPVTSLSTKYIIASYESWIYRPVEILIIATTKNTTVTIESPQSQQGSNETVQIAMNRLDSHIFTSRDDLSGSIVTSNKPIAIIAATDIAMVPEWESSPISTTGSESLFEWIVPVEFSGYDYIVPMLPEKQYYVVKVLPVYTDTTVILRNSTVDMHVRADTLTRNEFLVETNLFIHANKPIFVYQYGTSTLGIDSYGAFMRNIPAMEGFVSNVSFVIQTEEPLASNILQIMTPYKASIFLDDKPISSYTLLTNGGMDINSSFYEIFSILMPNSSSAQGGVNHHYIYSNTSVFGAMVVGFINNTQASYGYPLVQTAKVCTNERPSSHHGLRNYSSGLGPMCLECDDLEELYFCDVYTRCKSSQTCYVEKYQNHAAKFRYRAGCMDTGHCTYNPSKRRSEVTQCLDCCHGNFCNSNGCGSQGLPPREARGPMCLECLHSSSVEACGTLKFCEADEVCSIRVSKLFGSVHQYSMGCAHKGCYTEEHKRSVLLCAHCCRDDFCNHQCANSSFITPPMIG